MSLYRPDLNTSMMRDRNNHHMMRKTCQMSNKNNSITDTSSDILHHSTCVVFITWNIHFKLIFCIGLSYSPSCQSGLKLFVMTIETDVSAGQYTEHQGARETCRDLFLSPGTVFKWAIGAVPYLCAFKAWRLDFLAVLTHSDLTQTHHGQRLHGCFALDFFRIIFFKCLQNTEWKNSSWDNT